MKNERFIKKGIFTTFIFVLCLVVFGALALNNTQKKVKADEPVSMYYFDVDTTHENYLTIILYLFDAETLVDDSCTMGVFGYNKGTYQTEQRYITTQFLRYPAYDYMDHDAYIYNFNYISDNNYTFTYILLYSANDLAGQSITITTSYGFPYYPTFKTYYNDGFYTGWDVGFEQGTENEQEYWQTYIQNTYISHDGSGYKAIYQEGYDAGLIKGEELNTNWILSIIGTIGAFLEIEFFPGMTFGIILGVPFIISLAWFIIRMFRGGGGD